MVARVIGNRSYANVVKATEDKLNLNGPEFNLIGTDKGLPVGSLPTEECFLAINTKVKKGCNMKYSNLYAMKTPNKNTVKAPIRKIGKKEKKNTMKFTTEYELDEEKYLSNVIKEVNKQRKKMKEVNKSELNREFKQNKEILKIVQRETNETLLAIQKGNEIIDEIKEIFSNFDPDRTNGQSHEHRECVMEDLGSKIELMQDRNRENMKFVIRLIEHFCEIKNAVRLHNKNKRQSKKEVAAAMRKPRKAIKDFLADEYSHAYHRGNKKKGRQGLRSKFENLKRCEKCCPTGHLREYCCATSTKNVKMNNWADHHPLRSDFPQSMLYRQYLYSNSPPYSTTSPPYSSDSSIDSMADSSLPTIGSTNNENQFEMNEAIFEDGFNMDTHEVLIEGEAIAEGPYGLRDAPRDFNIDAGSPEYIYMANEENAIVSNETDREEFESNEPSVYGPSLEELRAASLSNYVPSVTMPTSIFPVNDASLFFTSARSGDEMGDPTSETTRPILQMVVRDRMQEMIEEVNTRMQSLFEYDGDEWENIIGRLTTQYVRYLEREDTMNNRITHYYLLHEANTYLAFIGWRTHIDNDGGTSDSWAYNLLEDKLNSVITNLMTVNHYLQVAPLTQTADDCKVAAKDVLSVVAKGQDTVDPKHDVTVSFMEDVDEGKYENFQRHANPFRDY